MTIHLDQGNGVDISSRIPEEWSVLDIGGWANILPRADFVIDIQSYETRRSKPGEHFGAESWLQMDLGGSQEYELPFVNQEFDFVWCQQTLEDLADPFHLMREIQRVGKAGFIEVPSREWEHTIGVDSPNFCGFCHHRWVIELDERDVLNFTFKSPYLAQYGALEGPPTYKYLGFVWSGSFDFREKHFLEKNDIIQDIVDFKNIRRSKQRGVYN